ncbi:hypothetical protein Tco_0276052 [Tanacetum coccineum]
MKKALVLKDNGGMSTTLLGLRVIKALHGSLLDRSDEELEEKGINLLLFMKKKLGNGLSTLFWDDVWCDGGKLKNRFPRAYALENSKQITSPDSWYWTLNNSGGYSVLRQGNMIDSRYLPKGDLMIGERDKIQQLAQRRSMSQGTKDETGASVGLAYEDSTIIRKLLNAVPDRFLQIVASIEQYSDLDEMSVDEAIGRLKTFKERLKSKKEIRVDSQESLMFTRHEGQGKPFRERGQAQEVSITKKNHEARKEEISIQLQMTGSTLEQTRSWQEYLDGGVNESMSRSGIRKYIRCKNSIGDKVREQDHSLLRNSFRAEEMGEVVIHIRAMLNDASQKEVTNEAVKQLLNGLQHLAYYIDIF